MNVFYLFMQSCELINVKLHMLGSHQLQNAATATCVALCLRRLGQTFLCSAHKIGPFLLFYFLFKLCVYFFSTLNVV